MRRPTAVLRLATIAQALVLPLVVAPRVAAAQQPRDSLVIPAIHGEALAFDAARGALVLFAGSAALPGTWTWDAGGWRRAADSAASPPARAGHAMAYDAAGGRVVLFGGMSYPPRTLHCDTWAFDGARWSALSPGPCMTDRVVNASLVFDAGARRLLLLDGPAVGGDAARPLRLWAWERDRWVAIDSAGPRRVGFSAAAYDARRSVLVVPVLFGGPDAGVWEWDGRTWTRSTAPGPSTRQTYALTYDPRRGRVVLAGGQGSTRGPYHDDVWTWDGTRWEIERPPAGAAPEGRGGGHLLADPRNARLLYFGGYEQRPLVDFWSLDATGWRRLSR